MTEEALVIALNQLVQSTSAQIEMLVKARNATLEMRIAAILYAVIGSDLPISTAVEELVVTLTEPKWESGSVDPMDTPFGKTIARLVQGMPKDSSSRTVRSVSEGVAIRLIQLAVDSSAIPDDSLDYLLRMTTGRNATWWLEWIREHRGR